MVQSRKRPGFKQALQQAGRYSASRESWVKTTNLDAILYVNEESETSEAGEDHVLTLVHPSRRPFGINLTSMTEAELNAVQEFINRAIDMARPIVQERDEVADNAFDQGDDSFTRNYRRPPELVVRTRKGRQHDQGVHDGSQDVPEMGGSSGGADLDAGEVRSDLAERAPEDREPEYDGSATVEPSDVLLVGGRPEDPVGLPAADAIEDGPAPAP